MHYVSVSFPRAVRIVWRLLDERPERRPRVDEIACAIGVKARHLRRAQRRHQSAKWRDLIAYACLTYALREIGRGVKIEAAIRAAGWHHRTSFYRRVREYFNCLPSDFRGQDVQLPVPVESDLIVEVERTPQTDRAFQVGRAG